MCFDGKYPQSAKAAVLLCARGRVVADVAIAFAHVSDREMGVRPCMPSHVIVQLQDGQVAGIEVERRSENRRWVYTAGKEWIGPAPDAGNPVKTARAVTVWLKEEYLRAAAELKRNAGSRPNKSKSPALTIPGSPGSSVGATAAKRRSSDPEAGSSTIIKKPKNDDTTVRRGRGRPRKQPTQQPPDSPLGQGFSSFDFVPDNDDDFDKIWSPTSTAK